MSDCRKQFNLSLHACKGRVKKRAFLENPHLLFHPPRGGQRSERAEEPIVVIREHCQSADNHGLACVSARHLIQSRARGSRAHNQYPTQLCVCDIYINSPLCCSASKQCEISFQMNSCAIWDVILCHLLYTTFAIAVIYIFACLGVFAW